MLSVGPVARHFSPSQNLHVKSEQIGNVHYRQNPLNEVSIKTGSSSKFVFLSRMIPGKKCKLGKLTRYAYRSN
jgi:hypothetical protein